MNIKVNCNDKIYTGVIFTNETETIRDFYFYNILHTQTHTHSNVINSTHIYLYIYTL